MLTTFDSFLQFQDISFFLVCGFFFHYLQAAFLSLVGCHFCLLFVAFLSANFDGDEVDEVDDGGALAGDLVLVALAFVEVVVDAPLGGFEDAGG